MKNALRPIGLALLAVAIVGAILVPTRADGWQSRQPLAWNLQNAGVIVRTEQVQLPDPPFPCPSSQEMQRAYGMSNDPFALETARRACERRSASAWASAIGTHPGPPRREVVFSAGDAFATLAGLALIGVGLIVLAPRGTRA